MNPIARPAFTRDVAIAIGLVALALAVYLICIQGVQTQFDYFGRLAHALARGRAYLDGAPLDELVRGRDGHFYSVLPPLVGILLVPLVPFGPSGAIQTFLSAVVGATSIGPLYLGLRALSIPRPTAIWAAVLSTFGTTLWVSAVDGRAWFAADAAGVLFGALAIWAAATGRHPALLGAIIGAGALARPPLLLAAPLLLLLARDRRAGTPLLRDVAWVALGMAPFGLLEAGYNLLRWGTPLEIGYALQAAGHPTAQRGLVHLSYLPRHLFIIFFRGPIYVDGDLLFLRAHTDGMSIFLSTPAYLYLARAAELWRSSRDLQLLAIASVLILLPNLFWFSAGYEQYGYRRSMDAQPFLIALVAIAASWDGARWSTRPTWLFRVAVILSVLVTLYFVIAIRVHGYGI